MKRLLPHLDSPNSGRALIAGDSVLTHAEVAGLSGRVAADLSGASRVAVWATPDLETCVGILGALRAGVTTVPVNPGAGSSELAHVIADSDPDAVVCAEGAALPAPLTSRPRITVGLAGPLGGAAATEPPIGDATFVLYTSGTTGPPKGVVISSRAIAADIDGLASAWEWTGDDVVAHALPLFHAHGLILGLLGPLRLGGTAMLLGRFSPGRVADALRGPATMFFGVPTMYRRIRLAAEEDPEVAAALAGARLLVSGSAALPTPEHAAIERLTGQRIVERYGMTETMITIAARSDGPRKAGSVGMPLPGVSVRLVDESGHALLDRAPETVGEIEVRGPTLFEGYLGLPDATREAYRDGWFRTGDLAVRDLDDSFRLVGRRETDLIKTGGYRVGAGEVEAALLEHPGVAEVAVTGEPDADLGQRIVAWVVPSGDPRPPAEELSEHVAGLLSPHKRPREIRFLESLPRSAVGKVQKHRLDN